MGAAFHAYRFLSFLFLRHRLRPERSSHGSTVPIVALELAAFRPRLQADFLGGAQQRFFLLGFFSVITL